MIVMPFDDTPKTAYVRAHAMMEPLNSHRRCGKDM